MKKTNENSTERYQQIIEWIPVVKQIISLGGKWEQLKGICEPLGLSDTSFREYPTENDYLLNVDYWKNKIELAKIENGSSDSGDAIPDNIPR